WGRGLVLVDGLALGWGIEQGPYGKTVWCELRAPGPLLDEGRAGEGGQRRVSGVSEPTRVSFSGLRT
ncbi:hypothetical protein AADR41_26125, partial [Streptomyces sp. CLV115]